MSFDLLRVLVVDDEVPLCRLFESAAPRLNWDVTTAHNGVTGLALARERVFDVIVLDQQMTDVSGLGVLRALRSERNLTPVVMYTGFPDFDEALEAGQLGVVTYLRKPTPMPLIDQKLRDAARLGPAVRPTPTPPPMRIWVRATEAAVSHLDGPGARSGPAAPGDFLNLFIDASLDAEDTTLAEFTALANLTRRVLASPHALRAAAQEFLAVANTATALGEHRHDRLAVRLLAAFAHPLGLHEPAVARELGIDPSTVRRYLWDLFGCGFKELRRAALIRPAIAPVARTTEPIGSIAIDCGCVSLTAERQFHRAWKKLLKVTASQLRARLASECRERTCH